MPIQAVLAVPLMALPPPGLPLPLPAVLSTALLSVLSLARRLALLLLVLRPFVVLVLFVPVAESPLAWIQLVFEVTPLLDCFVPLVTALVFFRLSMIFFLIEMFRFSQPPFVSSEKNKINRIKKRSR